MKKLLFILFTINCFSQTPTIEWQKSFGGTNIDGGYLIEQNTDGGYIVGGMTRSNDGDVTGINGYNDFWVVKINSLGIIQWQKALGGPGNEQVFAMHQTSDGGCVFGGVADYNGGNVTGTHGNSDFWVVKLNNLGTLEWQKAFGGTGDDVVKSIQQTSDGGYIVGGYTNSIDGDLSGTGTRIYPDSWIIKLSSTGEIQWQKLFTGSDYEIVHDIQQTSDGGYIVASETESIDSGATGYHGQQDFWLLKLDSLGTIQWQKALGGSQLDIPERIQQTVDGGYIAVGYTLSNDGDVTGNHGSYDYWAVKLSNSGTLEWQKTLGGTNYDRATSVQQSSDGNYIISGFTYSNDGNVTSNQGNADCWIVKLSANGILLWQKSIGGSAEDNAFSIKQTTDNGYVFTGFSKSNNVDITGNHGNGNYDMLVIKLSSDQLETISFLNQSLAVFPNPASNIIYLQVSDNVSINMITITDLMGKKILEQFEKTNEINIESLSSGMYFIQAFSGEKKYQLKFIKQ